MIYGYYVHAQVDIFDKSEDGQNAVIVVIILFGYAFLYIIN